MVKDGKIYFGKSGEEKIAIEPKMANRHGLIAGATGTGKTVTLKVLAESLSDLGVPVFLADVKGDLSGIAAEGVMNEKIRDRIETLGLSSEGFDFAKYPVSFWDVYQEAGLPLRTTVSEMGPLLLSKIMGLNQTQTDIMTVLFKIADDEKLFLIDTKDLRAMLQYIGEHAAEYSARYGNIAKQSLAAITRSVVALEAQGGELFFGEPALHLRDWFKTDSEGRGRIQILECEKLINSPTMYATFLLWLMSELFELLPEVGDMEKPRLVFFFDEAHLLFKESSKPLLRKIEQVVKLIRSKGVGIYFITQNPGDLPDEILAQLGNKIQHALHAYTPSETKAVKAAAMSFRENPEFDTFETVLSLGIGEAIVSVLDEKGIPSMAKKAMILSPQSFMGRLDDLTRNALVNGDELYPTYSNFVDNESAFEILERHKIIKEEEESLFKERELLRKEREKTEQKRKSIAEREMGRIGKTAAGTVGREIGNTIGKTVGGSFGKRLGGNLGAALGRGILSTLFGR